MEKRWIDRAFLAIVGVSLVVAGCGDDDGGTGPGTGPTAISFPLRVDNTWVYEVTETTLAVSARMDTSRIIGTQDVDGGTYYVLHDSGDDETEGTLIRQDGQDILVIPPMDASDGDPGAEWLNRVFEDNLPFKFADLDAPSGATWTIIEADTSFDVGGKTQTVQVSIIGRSFGRGSVSVPAGDYDDVYSGGVDGTLTIGSQAVPITDQLIWVADGIGLVKQITQDVGTGEGETVTERSELTSFELQ